jgi:WNK lysine deficient protein kinase
VDVYSFGMCMVEMLTLVFPYAECSNAAQIYKKVTAGRLPDAFYRVKDDDARRFIGRCLVAASKRPSAAELLMDPFLIDGPSTISPRRPSSLPPPLADDGDVPPFAFTSSNVNVSDDTCTLSDDHLHQEEPPAIARSDMMTITGKLNAEEDTIFLKVQIADETGHARNIYFPFDTASDTAMEVAREMVKELDITDRNPSEIAAMIEQEIDRLLPDREQHEYTYSYAAHDDDDQDEDQPRSSSLVLPLLFPQLITRVSLQGGGHSIWPTWRWVVQR